MAKKGNRVYVILQCKKDGRSRYFTTKNKKNTPDRIKRMKYNPYLREHTEHVEIK